MILSPETPGAEATRVVDAVLRDLATTDHRGVVVDSPPGAGKSTLVVRAAGVLAATGTSLMIVAQTNEQVDDLIARLGVASPTLSVGRLSAVDYAATERVREHPSCRVGAKVADLGGPPVTIGTAAKWATVTEGTWPWAIVDEAYQMRSDALLRVAPRFERALFVGDPGQLDPFSTVEVDRWTGLSWDPMQSAVAVLLRHNPQLPVHRLPVSWRLPASAAPVVAAAFYPFTGFRSGTGPGERSLSFAAPATTDLDTVLDTAAATGWGLHELPARFTVRTDAEAAAACADLAARALTRDAVAVSEAGSAPLTASRIAIGAAHRDQVAAIRALLPEHARDITVDTANRLQGREYDLTVVLHPLSGRRDATAFHLESGRLCVLTSRHRHACVVVARAGIAELLDAHPSTEPVHLGVPVKFPDGWEANQSMLAHLSGLTAAARP
ncbi:AAA family ATPase [Amorphoplanes digitatis]|uniref:Energy-coupling factor transporter ATP-binding protein EcfA2 n=1 Tax=Actinoplanes digitatis TaxID=1868 RepID=A0A7W7MTE9_9ACTN|nr:energy-coupling factor transporter ATP-binding protein EcfA2 [Actinoplanes digitatis]GID95974.1 helicase [Actinoplanes digitatis]